MPKIAEFVDQCRAVFGEVKVKFASENGISKGIQSTERVWPVSSFCSVAELAGWAGLDTDSSTGSGKAQEPAEQTLLGSPTRNRRAARHK